MFNNDIDNQYEFSEITWKGNYQSEDNTKIEKKGETLTEKMKRSLDDRYT